MVVWLPIAVSGIALVVSITTAWLTFFRRGNLRMTQPTVIFFGPDGYPREGEKRRLKVFLRTLLYSTSPRGQTVESMHVNVQRAESKQNFSIWVYGDLDLNRGSGIFVGADGIACNHHFLLPEDGADFKLLPGDYTLRTYAKRVCDSESLLLNSVRLTITETQATDLENEDAGIYFDWGPDQQAYQAHVERRKEKEIPRWLLEPPA